MLIRKAKYKIKEERFGLLWLHTQEHYYGFPLNPTTIGCDVTTVVIPGNHTEDNAGGQYYYWNTRKTTRE
jgi:hypothetical protein